MYYNGFIKAMTKNKDIELCKYAEKCCISGLGLVILPGYILKVLSKDYVSKIYLPRLIRFSF